MADEMKREVIVEVKLEGADTEKRVSQLTKTISELRADTEKLTKANKELEKNGRKNSEVFQENSKGIEINKQLMQEATAERKNLITTLLSEDKSIKALTARNKELIKQRNDISTTTAEGRAQIALINSEIDENTEIIKQNSAAHEKQSKNVGNYKSALDGLSPGLSSTVEGHKEMLATLTPMGAAIGAAAAAVGGMFALYAKSVVGARDLARAQDLLSHATSMVAESFAEVVTNGKNQIGFFEGLSYALVAYFSPVTAAASLAAASAKDMLRELEISERFAQQFYKEDERRAELNRRIRDDETKSYTERLAAAQRIDKYMENAGDRQIIVWQAQIEQIKRSTVNYDLNREAQLKVAEIEAEISDKREEITGKLTENVMAVNALTKEYAELQRTLRLEQYEQELQEQHELFVQEMEKRTALKEQEADIMARFNKRIADETKARLKEETDAEKKAAKDREQLEKMKVEYTVGGLQLITKERSQARVIGNAILKRDAIQETAINTQAAAMSAYKALAGIPIIGPVLGAAAAVAAIIYGGARIAAMTGIAFANGGKVPGYADGGLSGTRIMESHGIPIQRSNGDNRLATVRTGEVILNKRHQQALGGDATFRAIGVPGFASGGYTGMVQTSAARGSVQEAVDRQEMLSALTQVRTVLVLQDFESAQAAKNAPIQRSQVL